MRIAIDARMIAHSGIGTYSRELLGRFALEAAGTEFVVFTLRGLASRVPRASHFEVREVDIPVYSAAEHLAWPRLVDAARCDLLHVPHYNAPAWGRTPLIATVHDLVHWRFPEFMRHRWHATVARLWLRRTAARARGLVCGSEATRADLVSLLDVDPRRISVIPYGVDGRFRPAPPAAIAAFRARHALPARFFLHVGLRRPHKNLTRLVHAYGRYAGATPEPAALVLWGARDGRDQATNEAIHALGLEAAVVERDTRVPSDELPLLYGAALALVQPSLYEGFGLPPLEAMACGVPVVCSAGGALVEVTGGAALVADGLDVEAWAQALGRIERDTELRADLVRRGLVRACEFDWGVAAVRTRQLYAALLS